MSWVVGRLVVVEGQGSRRYDSGIEAVEMEQPCSGTTDLASIATEMAQAQMDLNSQPGRDSGFGYWPASRPLLTERTLEVGADDPAFQMDRPVRWG